MLSDAARSARAELVGDADLDGAAFGAALADLVDRVVRDALTDAVADVDGARSWAVLAMGSYARRELAPGSDVDVMLVHDGSRRKAPDAETAGRLWYPLWDAGFTLGQSVRSVKEALAVADDDLDALTALLDVRLVGGDVHLATDLSRRVRALAPRRRGRVLAALVTAAAARFDQPGPVAEMLEPDLKNGAGGLRDVQAPGWAGWLLPGEEEPDPLTGAGWEGGVARLVARGYLDHDDRDRLRDARGRLLDARLALHRAGKGGNGRSDRLPLQDQDAVAALVGATDADDLMRSLGEAARAVVWITRDLWTRLQAAEAGPGGQRVGNRELGHGVVLRDGRVGFATDAFVDARTVLRAAAYAARTDARFERSALARLAAVTEIEWDDDARAAFVDLLDAGRGAISVFETLDHVGLLVRLLPEWAGIRALPQRNAYHRFTVDRHSLEAVAETAALREQAAGDKFGDDKFGDDKFDGNGFDGDVARRPRRDVLLLGALLHDIAKGRPGDHSVSGEEIARTVAQRMGVDPSGTDDLGWLVRNHLLLVDTATRRDLGEERTIARYVDEVGDAGRNALLYALSIGDSRATGPAAWNASKAALVRELFVKADARLHAEVTPEDLTDVRAELAAVIGAGAADELLDVMPASYARAFAVDEVVHHRDLLAEDATAVEWRPLDDGRWRCTVVAPDRTGMLATAAGALALVGLDIEAAAAYGHPNGRALEVFSGRDRFGRLEHREARDGATATVMEALAGAPDLDERLRDRARRYRRTSATAVDREVRVLVDTDASASATVVDVHAPDDVGLLARIATVFVDLDLDVTQAIVSTLGERVVDVFYLHDASGTRFEHRHSVEALRATLLSRLTAAVTLDERAPGEHAGDG